MIIVSYDISDDKMRTNFSKMLKRNGAIRLQYSVYEISNTKRIVDNLVAKIEAYAKHFTADDSVIFEILYPMLWEGVVILFKKICRRCLYLKDFLYLCNR